MKMKRTIYAVGDSIETAEYSSWLSKKLLPVTNVPKKKTKYDAGVVTQSLTHSSNVQYFLTYELALQYAVANAEEHFFREILIKCPVIFDIKVNVSKSDHTINVTDIILARIPMDSAPTVVALNLNYQIPPLTHTNTSSASMLSWLTSSPQQLTCTRDNGQAVYEKLMRTRECLTFLLINHRGIKRENQDETYKLPKDMRVEIGDHIFGLK